VRHKKKVLPLVERKVSSYPGAAARAEKGNAVAKPECDCGHRGEAPAFNGKGGLHLSREEALPESIGERLLGVRGKKKADLLQTGREKKGKRPDKRRRGRHQPSK